MSKTIFQLWIATAALPKLKFQTNKQNKFYSFLLLCSLIVQTKNVYINDEKDPLKTVLMEKNGHLSQNSKLYLSLAIEDHIQPAAAESVSLLLHPRGPVRCLREAVSGRVLTHSQDWPNTEYIRFLRKAWIPNTKYMRFLKMNEYWIVLCYLALFTMGNFGILEGFLFP